ncbi:MAG: hypothetical protein ACQCN6_08060 [Candidatus Bathyarchaeia archaeon]|jgi:hypothetical protein
MRKRILALIIISVICTALYASINFTRTLEINFQVDFAVYVKDNDFSGYGYIETNSISMAIDKWPSYASDHNSVNINHPYSDNTKIDQLFMFKVIVKLNDVSKTVEITNFPQTGNYIGKITCCFNNVQSGNHTLTIAIYAKGSTEPVDCEVRTIFVT